MAEYVAAHCMWLNIVALYVAEHCNFVVTLDEMLLDRLVCNVGIANVAVQNCLLTKLKLAFTKVVTIVQAVELAEKDSRKLQSTPVRDFPEDIHKFSHLINSKKSSHK